VKVSFTKPFQQDHKGLPENIKDQIDKQIIQLVENPKPPFGMVSWLGKNLS
jgi:mRNA-degrading endonuclease RelE of RelBE toxin-antitoxin system